MNIYLFRNTGGAALALVGVSDPALAQGAPGFEKALEVLLGNGILGAVIVILIFAVTRLFTLYTKSQDERVTILRDSIRELNTITDAVKQMTEINRQLVQRMEKLEDRVEQRRERQ